MKPQETTAKEGGAIDSALTLLQVAGILLIYHLGELPLYPALNEAFPK